MLLITNLAWPLVAIALVWVLLSRNKPVEYQLSHTQYIVILIIPWLLFKVIFKAAIVAKGVVAAFFFGASIGWVATLILCALVLIYRKIRRAA